MLSSKVQALHANTNCPKERDAATCTALPGTTILTILFLLNKPNKGIKQLKEKRIYHIDDLYQDEIRNSP
eukprot:c23565_g1_i2 orf=1243-1452(+)